MEYREVGRLGLDVELVRGLPMLQGDAQRLVVHEVLLAPLELSESCLKHCEKILCFGVLHWVHWL